MSSEPTRDPRTDPLLTAANSALVVIDYQPNQIKTVTSMDTELLVRNMVSVARLGKAYGLPIVSLACELQRDWARTKTVPAVVDIVLTSRLLKGI